MEHLLTLEALYIGEIRPELNTKDEYQSRELTIKFQIVSIVSSLDMGYKAINIFTDINKCFNHLSKNFSYVSIRCFSVSILCF